ncbi:MAG TPA: CBS domain-containing protein [Anaerolineaceae bacterium]|nr:CBS domain-containing protein [Anaerolineaceae bacterium]HQN04454.1 CBS domain-containing protein [Anaerolineaceae bacterium]HQP07717.1 CBS domain-containing protein [Anaerolineaceae bacterium]
MLVTNWMKKAVFSIYQGQSLGQAAELLVQHHIGTLPVIDLSGRLVGVITLADVLRVGMPDFIQLVDDFKFVHDFGAMERFIPDGSVLNHSVDEKMHEPISVDEKATILHAAAVMQQSNLRDLPVTDSEGKLIGIVSHVDIGVALIRNWNFIG